MTNALRALAAALLLALGGTPALAAPQAATLTEQDKRDLARIEAYLNDISTMQARFLQVAQDGSQAEGTFYMARPGRLRFEYDAPLEHQIIADGSSLFYWDGELEELSQIPLGATLADLIVRPEVKLSGDLTVTGIERRPGLIAVSLVMTDDPDQGTMTLLFQDRPLQLKQWRVVDAQGLATDVALMNPQYGLALPGRLFNFVNPNFHKN